MGIQINGQTDIISAIDGGLTVSGADLGSASASSLNISGIVTASGGLLVGTGASISSPTTNVLTLGTNNSERVRIDSSGNVGIGTDNPQRLLHLYSGSNNPLLIESPDQFADIVQADTGGSTRLRSDQGALKFYTGGDASSVQALNATERLGITSTGDINVAAGSSVFIANGNLVFSTSGTGIDFSTTANSSGTMTSELLNDYEEGTWSPSIYGTTTAGTTTYFQRAGTYTKVGRVVTVQVFVTITNQTGTGALRLGNLPFTAGSGANTFPCAVKIENLALFASHYPVFSVAGGTTYINMEQTPVGGGAIYGIAIDTAFNVELTATYFV
jgi:hypothetical protein